MILTSLLISCIFTTRVLVVTTMMQFGWNEIIIFKLDKKSFTSISTYVFIYDCPTTYFLISFHGRVKEDQLNSHAVRSSYPINLISTFHSDCLFKIFLYHPTHSRRLRISKLPDFSHTSDNMPGGFQGKFTKEVLMAQLEQDPIKFLRNLSRHAQEYGSIWIPELLIGITTYCPTMVITGLWKEQCGSGRFTMKAQQCSTAMCGLV